jgi:hypothetical protein
MRQFREQIARRSQRTSERSVRHETPIEVVTEETPMENDDQVSDETSKLANKLVKLAISAEHGRVPIKKTIIYKEVLGEIQGAKLETYQKVLADAQEKLRRFWGMELVPLPKRDIPVELMDISAPVGGTSARPAKRRKHVKTEATADELDSEEADAFILRYTLPERYRKVVETRSETEKNYMAYVYIVCCILILGKGFIRKSDLMHDYVDRLGIKSTHLGDFTAILGRMQRHHYLVYKKMQDSDHNNIDYYYLGPRAKVEFTESGFKHMCATYLRGKYNDDVEEQITDKLENVNIPVEKPQIAEQTTNQTAEITVEPLQ